MKLSEFTTNIIMQIFLNLFSHKFQRYQLITVTDLQQDTPNELLKISGCQTFLLHNLLICWYIEPSMIYPKEYINFGTKHTHENCKS